MLPPSDVRVPSSKDRRKRSVIKPRIADPAAPEKDPGEGFRSVDDLPAEPGEHTSVKMPVVDPEKTEKIAGAGFRPLDALRQSQIDTNSRRERRSKRSTIVEEPQWDGEGPENTLPVRKKSPRAKARARVIAYSIAIIIGAGFFTAFAAVLWSALARPAPEPAMKPASIPAPVEGRDFNAMVDEAIATAEKFFAAESFDERSEFLHDADRVLPLMKKHSSDRAIEDDRPLRIGIKEAYLIEIIGRPEQFLITSLERRDRATREIVLVGSGDRDWKVDWEGFVGYSETNWNTIADRRPIEPERSRVIATGDDYYNFEFDDEERYACFRLSDDARALTLYGYVERGSAVEFDMHQALADRAYGLLILDLKFRDGSATGNQVEIVKVVASSWLPGIGLQIHAVTERMQLPN